MSRRHEQQLVTIAQIDVTPLVDLTFLLLIVFMITASALEFTVPVTPPQLNATPIPEARHRIITLDADGNVYLDTAPVSQDELLAALQILVETAPETQVFIRADETQPYGEVMAIMRLVKDAGVASFSLVTAAETD